MVDVLNHLLDIPLNNVLERLPSSFGVVPPQTTALVGMVKALRACAAELVDARLLLEEPSLESDGWHQAGSAAAGSKSRGGYELRRKDWTRGNIPAMLSYSKKDWQERTIYVVRLFYACMPLINVFQGAHTYYVSERPWRAAPNWRPFSHQFDLPSPSDAHTRGNSACPPPR